MGTDQGNGWVPPSVDPEGIETRREFGAALSRLREAAGLTVRQLAERAGVPRGTVQGYLKGDHLPPAGFPDPLVLVLRTCGERAPERLDAWVTAAGRARRSPGRRADPHPPFPGLASYGRDDAEWFHGRDALTGLVVARVEWKLDRGGGPLVVVGPSGAGKTSLLTAGVLPSLAEHGHDAVLLPPGQSDPRNGAGWHGVVVADQFEEVFARDTADGDRLARIAALCRELPGTAVVLGVRADFYPHLLRHPALAAAAQSDQVVVGPMSPAELRDAITVPVRRARTDPDDDLVDLVLRDLEPKHRDGPDGGAHDPGALPLLSHALRAAWDRHQGDRLTVADYLAGGGIARSIAQSADKILADLTPGQRDTARRLFRRLVRADEEAADTRRRVPLAELLDADGQPGAAGETEAVLERFTSARLVTVGEHTVEITHEALLTAWPRLRSWLDDDREWLLLHRRTGAAAAQWRDAGRDPDLLPRAGALASLREWTEQRGRRGDLNALEGEFLGAGVAHRLAEDSRDRRRVRQRYRLFALVAVLLVVVASVAGVAAQQRAAGTRQRTQALSRQVAGEADHLRGNNVALSLQLALAAYRISPTPEARSALIDSTAVTPDTQTAPSAGPAVSLVTTGHLVAGGCADHGVQLWRAGPDGQLTALGAALTGPRGALLPVALSRDGTRLAGADTTGSIRLWSTTQPTAPLTLATLHGPRARIVALALSGDGTRLAAGSEDGETWLWNLGAGPSHASGVRLTGTGTVQVESLVFTPDGRTLVSGDDGSAIRLWDTTAAPAPVGRTTTPGGRVFSLAVSPDGRTLAAGTSTGHDVTLWHVADPAHPAPAGTLTGPSTWVNTVAFSPDGRTVAAGASDGLLWFFDAHDHRVLRRLPHPRPVISTGFLYDGTPLALTQDGLVHTWHLPGPVLTGSRDSVFAVSFDADGRRLGVSPGSNDDTVTVWDPSDVHHPVRLGPPLPGAAGSGAFSGSGALSPDGRTFAIGDLDGTVTLWNITDQAHPVRAAPPVRAAGALIESVSFDHRGSLLATAADDNTVSLFAVRNPARPTSVARIVLPGGGEVLQTAFNPDDTLLAAASSGDHAYLYDVSHPDRPRLLAPLAGFPDAVYCVAFSPDGRILAVGAADGTVRLWDVSHPTAPSRIPGELGGPVGYIYAVAFAPKGRTLVMSSNEDADLWLWDLADPRRPRHLATLTGPEGGVFSAAFAPHGGVLAAGGVQHTVQLWDTDPGRAATWICSVVGRRITRAQWDQYLPGTRYRPPCPAGRTT